MAKRLDPQETEGEHSAECQNHSEAARLECRAAAGAGNPGPDRHCACGFGGDGAKWLARHASEGRRGWRAAPAARIGQSNPHSRKAGGRGWEYLDLAGDDYSRLAWSGTFADATRKPCRRFRFNALRFFRKHGVKVWRLMTGRAKVVPSVRTSWRVGELLLKALRQGIENAKDKAQSHQTLHPENQRQGRARLPGKRSAGGC